MADPIVTITNGVPTAGTGQITTLGQVLDPTNGPASIKAASTPPVATDKSLVIAQNPNSLDFGAGTAGTKTQRIIVDSSQFSPLGAATKAASAPVALATDQTFNGQNQTAPTSMLGVGGQFNTAPTTLVSGNVSPLQLDSAGNLLVNIKAPATVPVSGTVTTTPPANASTNLSQVGGAAVATGTGISGAGIPRVTVSSDSSVSINASLPAGANTIGNVGIVAGAAAIGTVGVTSLPSIPAGANAIGSVTVTSTVLPTGAATAANQNTGFADVSVALAAMTALNAATQIALAGSNSVAVLLTGTWVGTLVPEVSVDGGTTWVATQFYNVNTHAASNTATANGTYDIMGTGGKSHARVRLSAFTSGTVTGNLRASSQAPSATDSEILLNTTTAGSIPAGSNVIGAVNLNSQFPTNAATPNPVPFVASVTGTTLATALTLPAQAGKKTYITGFSVRSNATAAATGNITVTNIDNGTGTAQTANYTHFTAALANGIGVTEPPLGSVPLAANAANTAPVITAPAPGAGGTVSVTAWGYML